MKKSILLIGLLILGVIECAQISANPNPKHEIFSAIAVEKLQSMPVLGGEFSVGVFIMEIRITR